MEKISTGKCDISVHNENVNIYISLKQIREARKISIRQLAYMSGVSKSQISAIENEKSIPTILVLCQLAAALHVKPEELYEYK